jgi:hypothetical protein
MSRVSEKDIGGGFEAGGAVDLGVPYPRHSLLPVCQILTFSAGGIDANAGLVASGQREASRLDAGCEVYHDNLGYTELPQPVMAWKRRIKPQRRKTQGPLLCTYDVLRYTISRVTLTDESCRSQQLARSKAKTSQSVRKTLGHPNQKLVRAR